MRGLLVRYGLAMTSVMLVAFLVPLGLLARSLAAERALAAAQQDAQQVAMFAGVVADDPARLQATLLAVNAGARRTSVFLPDGTVEGAPAPRGPAVELASLGRALTARTDGGVEVLQPVGGAAGVAVVRTFVPDSQLQAGVLRAWSVLALVGAVLLGGAVLAGDRIAARLSRSVRDLADVAERLGSGDLAARAEPSGPAEVASVGAVLNGLGDRVAGLLADERELVADLSHRLRTPITALRLDVDMLADPDERDRMAAHVDGLVGAVDTVIHAARSHAPRTPEVCDAAAVVRARATFWEVLTTHEGRPLRVDVPPTAARVAVGAGELGAALDVLVDNVLRHTPAGTALELTVRPGPG
ncbi:MAG: HAMP domain-containing protein, partial [Cellulomonas sp.]|nr:HAMP domain-containing protein [Cellulomonas sp.]